MKHLKTYQIFESNEEDRINNYLRDIFLELEDDGYNVEIDNRYIRTSEYEEFTGILVKIERKNFKFPVDTFLLENIYETILTCKSYLKETKFFITDISCIAIDGDRPYRYGLDYGIHLHELNPEKYKLFNKPLINLELSIRKEKL
jgi:hypothetical protein